MKAHVWSDMSLKKEIYTAVMGEIQHENLRPGFGIEQGLGLIMTSQKNYSLRVTWIEISKVN